MTVSKNAFLGTGTRLAAAYAAMLDAAKSNAFAFPAINVSSSQTLNAALQGFAEAESDGIIQISTGGGEFASGPATPTSSSAPPSTPVGRATRTARSATCARRGGGWPAAP